LIPPRVTVTVTVGVCFACPDPKQVAWRQEETRLKALTVADPAYPSKAQRLPGLNQSFRQTHPQVRINAVLADALYGTQALMDQARFRGRERPLAAFFAAYPGVAHRIRRRGDGQSRPDV
jgi:hypothetical protein